MFLGSASLRRPPERVRPNDNREGAGTLRGGVLTLGLEARLAMWHPDGDENPGAEVPAFALPGQPAEIPGPMIRVPAGTEVVVRVRNRVRDTLVVHGLHARALLPARSGPGALADRGRLTPWRITPGRGRILPTSMPGFR